VKIKILCYRAPVCYAVWRVVQQAVGLLSIHFPEVKFEIEMIKDSQEIGRYTQNLLLPSLVIDEKLVCAGHIPSQEEVTSWLQMALANRGYMPVVLDR